MCYLWQEVNVGFTFHASSSSSTQTTSNIWPSVSQSNVDKDESSVTYQQLKAHLPADDKSEDQKKSQNRTIPEALRRRLPAAISATSRATPFASTISFYKSESKGKSIDVSVTQNNLNDLSLLQKSETANAIETQCNDNSGSSIDYKLSITYTRLTDSSTNFPRIAIVSTIIALVSTIIAAAVFLTLHQ